MSNCPLCNICDREPENVLWMSDEYAIVRTKDLKGHRERVMIILKQHMPTPFWDMLEQQHMTIAFWEHLITIPGLVEEIKHIFDYTYKVVVMDGKYGSIPDHWHFCVTDLDPRSKDHYQILGTPWIKVIDIKPWS